MLVVLKELPLEGVARVTMHQLPLPVESVLLEISGIEEALLVTFGGCTFKSLAVPLELLIRPEAPIQ